MTDYVDCHLLLYPLPPCHHVIICHLLAYPPPSPSSDDVIYEQPLFRENKSSFGPNTLLVDIYSAILLNWEKTD